MTIYEYCDSMNLDIEIIRFANERKEPFGCTFTSTDRQIKFDITGNGSFEFVSGFGKDHIRCMENFLTKIVGRKMQIQIKDQFMYFTVPNNLTI